MLTITIEGPQGEGKTKIGEAIVAIAAAFGVTAKLFDDEDIVHTRIPYTNRKFGIIVICKQTRGTVCSHCGLSARDSYRTITIGGKAAFYCEACIEIGESFKNS